MCISGHFHADRTAGLGYYVSKGIKAYTSLLTDSLSIVNNEPRAQYHFDKDTSFCIGQYSFSTFYPGEGHTKDNLVIWFEKEKILYGDVLLKVPAMMTQVLLAMLTWQRGPRLLKR
jgi:metallo-beta-lactamase class B